MATTPKLNHYLSLKAKNEALGLSEIVPQWGPGEFLCPLNSDCPHKPYTAQSQTWKEDPKGQIQFFELAAKIGVRRNYYSLADGTVQHCGEQYIRIDRDDYCPNGCDGYGPYPNCATSYTDVIVSDPAKGFTTDVSGVFIDDPFSFEMDHDYNLLNDSAPSCENMWIKYGQNYGDPDWDWEPSSCAEGRKATSVFTSATISAGSTTVHAAHIRDLRERIDALREGVGLAAFAWRDPEIIYGVTPVKAVHVTDLRSALNAAYAAAGHAVPVYTDYAIVAGVTPIKAVHMTELRAAVVAVEK